jgi:DNA-binding transcriptional MocR family regulator
MTSWIPDLAGRSGARYLAIADALAADIATTKLEPGDRLPTHRDLAWRLGVTVGTISRAYAEAERRGLVTGEVGRGTYVRGGPATEHNLMSADVAEPGGRLTDLTFNFPPRAVEPGELAAALKAMAEDVHADAWLDYQPSAGRPAHREAGAVWLRRGGLEIAPEHVVVTAGAQHGVLTVLSALTRPGDRIAVEALTYPGIKLIARTLGLRLDSVAMDDDGIIPDAFDALCRSGDPKALYCIPTQQNPTALTMSAGRRQEIVEIARRHGVPIVEDDLMRLLVPTAPQTLATLAPEITYHVTSLSKTVASGLRIGFVAGPADATDRLAGAVRATCWMAAPLSVEVGARWIADGTAERILASRRREVSARRARVLAAFGRWAPPCPEGSMHLWLPLPEPWRANGFAAEARARGVAVTPAESFAVSRRDVTHAVRVCFGAAPDLASLDRATEVLVSLLESGPSSAALGTVV